MSSPQLLLGQHTNYSEEYNPAVLFPIARNQGRSSLALAPFQGYDLWRIYELTYLAPNGLPQCFLATLKIPCSSPYIVESKSLKLYLGSFCQTIFASTSEVASVINHDLSDLLDTQVEVKLYPIGTKAMPIVAFDSHLLENEPEMKEARFKCFMIEPNLLK